MASSRTVRAFAAVAAVPLALGALGGVAHAADTTVVDDSVVADWETEVTSLDSGILGENWGNVTDTQQAATGESASNQNNNASVIGPGVADIDQYNKHDVTVIYGSVID